MLRFDYLPSDFHPQFLVLGEREDLMRLASDLDQLATTARRCHLSQEAAGGAEHMHLWISAAASPRGLRKTGEGTYEWELTPLHAQAFSAQIRSIAQQALPAGSVVLKMDAFDPEEIPVWVSQGEFTDNYLIDSF